MKSKQKFRRASLYVALALGFAAVFAFGEQFRLAYEVLSVNVAPDAQKAFAYGQRHFDSRQIGAYNIDAAEYFYWKAHELDPNLPYLYHEISRIEFLRGKFDTALVFINAQIDRHGSSTPNSYYVRGLIQGYRGAYDEAARDYETYLQFDPASWAALNDYAWVLLKAGRPDDALTAIARGLAFFPENAWLLNSQSIALYELGHHDAARLSAESALKALAHVNEAQWLAAYPGNDPSTARQGMATLRGAIEKNMHMAGEALRGSAVE